jgi:hypothetical protein
MAHEHEGKDMLHKRPGDPKTFKYGHGPLGKDARQSIDDPQPLNQQGGKNKDKT